MREGKNDSWTLVHSKEREYCVKTEPCVRNRMCYGWCPFHAGGCSRQEAGSDYAGPVGVTTQARKIEQSAGR